MPSKLTFAPPQFMLSTAIRYGGSNVSVTRQSVGSWLPNTMELPCGAAAPLNSPTCGPPGQALSDGLAEGQYACPEAANPVPLSLRAMLSSPFHHSPVHAAIGTV